jgi:hypothetical protein
MKLTFLLALVLCTGFHPMHISVTEIVYDEREKEVEIICRIFLDDLETALRTQLKNPEWELLNAAGKVAVREPVEAYALAHLKIALDNKPLKLVVLGTEKEDDALLVYVQATDIKRWKTIDVSATILHELFDDQSNLVHITQGSTVRSLRLIKSASSGRITFQ